MVKYRIYSDPDELNELCAYTPYNLKKDLKDISETELSRILEEIANELYRGINRPPISSPVYWNSSRNTAYVKIRILDIKRNAGKSNGYRCMLLVDQELKCAFLLHIYRHGHGENVKKDKKSENNIKKLVNDYVKSKEHDLMNK